EAALWEESAAIWKEYAAALGRGDETEAERLRTQALALGGWEKWPGAAYAYGKVRVARAKRDELGNQEAALWEESAEIWKEYAAALGRGDETQAERLKKQVSALTSSSSGSPLYCYRKARVARAKRDELGNKEAALWEESAAIWKECAATLARGDETQAERLKKQALALGGWEWSPGAAWPGAAYAYGKARVARAKGDELGEKEAEAWTELAEVLKEEAAALVVKGDINEAEYVKNLSKISSKKLNAINNFLKTNIRSSLSADFKESAKKEHQQLSERLDSLHSSEKSSMQPKKEEVSPAATKETKEEEQSSLELFNSAYEKANKESEKGNKLLFEAMDQQTITSWEEAHHAMATAAKLWNGALEKESKFSLLSTTVLQKLRLRKNLSKSQKQSELWLEKASYAEKKVIALQFHQEAATEINLLEKAIQSWEELLTSCKSLFESHNKTMMTKEQNAWKKEEEDLRSKKETLQKIPQEGLGEKKPSTQEWSDDDFDF
ncbi:MAG: hypothetical protein K2W99_08470, partial [Chthoniobacterales bacterium]|nr:hypothetical protein [Chthoniobacterales bacterium]